VTTSQPEKPSDSALRAITRGTVLVIDISDARGFEQNKSTRTAIVVSSDTLNKKLATLIVVPTTSQKGRSAFPHEVPIPQGEGGLDADSFAQPVQIRTIDRFARVRRILGHVEPETMMKIGMKIVECLTI